MKMCSMLLRLVSLEVIRRLLALVANTLGHSNSPSQHGGRSESQDLPRTTHTSTKRRRLNDCRHVPDGDNGPVVVRDWDLGELNAES